MNEKKRQYILSPSLATSLPVLFVVPTLRIGGGTFEVIRLASDLRLRDIDARITSLWVDPHSVPVTSVPVSSVSNTAPHKGFALFAIIPILLQFRRFLKALESQVNGNVSVFLTHYSTLPFGWFTPHEHRYCFVQGVECTFIPSRVLRWMMTKFILSNYSKCRVITTNPYLTAEMKKLGIIPVAETPIWANDIFSSDTIATERSIDAVMVLRHGHVKRLNLYEQLLRLLNQDPKLSLAIITPETEILDKVSRYASTCLLRPSKQEMKDVFQHSKVFILLSEHEGFGLPPLEAMGSGCIPMCRDAGGVRCFMQGSLERNLIPMEETVASIALRVRKLISDQLLCQKLAVESATIFKEGHAESFAKRENALDLLATSLYPNSLLSGYKPHRIN